MEQELVRECGGYVVEVVKEVEEVGVVLGQGGAVQGGVA